PRRLDICNVPVARAEHPQEGFRMHRARADLRVERLLDDTPARGPELRQLQNQRLKRHRRRSRSTRVDLSSFSRWDEMSARCACWIAGSAPGLTARPAIPAGLAVRAADRNALASSDSRSSVW